jgi:hypothetical protein
MSLLSFFLQIKTKQKKIEIKISIKITSIITIQYLFKNGIQTKRRISNFQIQIY